MTDNPISAADRAYKIHSGTIVPSKMNLNITKKEKKINLKNIATFIQSILCGIRL